MQLDRRTTPAARALIEQDQIGVQIVRHGNSEKKQNESDTDGGPFLQWALDFPPSLIHPTRTPGPDQTCSYQYP
jgi:hypothetical protein